MPSPTTWPGLRDISNTFAGWADTLTDGGTQRVREELGYDDGVDKDSKYYAHGQVVPMPDDFRAKFGRVNWID